MRPRRMVLLYCADEMTGSRLGFVLPLRLSVIVTATFSLDTFREACAGFPGFDSVLAVRTEMGEKSGQDELVLRLLRVSGGDLRAVEVQNGLGASQCSTASRIVVGRVDVAMADIVERVGLASARKRGPSGAAPRFRIPLPAGKSEAA